MEQVIELLEATKKQASEHLQDKEEIRIRVENTLTRLVDGLRHSAGIGITAATATEAATAAASGKLTHVMGRPIAPREPVKKALREVVPTQKEISNTELMVMQAAEELPSATPADLKEKYGDLTLRALAVKLGMDVTPTEPAKINAEFIKQMKATQAEGDNKAAAVKTATAAATRPATNAEEAARLAEEAAKATESSNQQ